MDQIGLCLDSKFSTVPWGGKIRKNEVQMPPLLKFDGPRRAFYGISAAQRERGCRLKLLLYHLVDTS